MFLSRVQELSRFPPSGVLGVAGTHHCLAFPGQKNASSAGDQVFPFRLSPKVVWTPHRLPPDPLSPSCLTAALTIVPGLQEWFKGKRTETGRQCLEPACIWCYSHCCAWDKGVWGALIPSLDLSRPGREITRCVRDACVGGLWKSGCPGTSLDPTAIQLCVVGQVTNYF